MVGVALVDDEDLQVVVPHVVGPGVYPDRVEDEPGREPFVEVGLHDLGDLPFHFLHVCSVHHVSSLSAVCLSGSAGRRRPVYQSCQSSPASFQIFVPGPVAGLVITCPGRGHPGFG